MPQIQEQQQVNITINDLIYAQVKDLGNRMDRLERRQDKLEEKLERTRQELNARLDKQDAKIEKLADKIDANQKELNERIDKLSDKIDKFSGHGQIATISSIGVGVAVAGVAVGVLCSLLLR